MRCLSVDFGGSAVKYALVDESANMTNGGKLPAPLASKEQFVETVYLLYEKFKDQIEGITISLPGYIDSKSGYLYGSGAYLELYKCNILDLIREKCPINLAVESDGKCGALSEAWKGSLSGFDDGAVIILGSAIGGGIIKNKKIHLGKNFAAGELSYMITNPHKDGILKLSFMSIGMLGMTYKLCKFKNIDLTCQDAKVWMEDFDQKLHSQYPTFSTPPQKIKVSGKKIFNWLEQGDADAVLVYIEFIKSLAIMVHNVQICYAPDRIVIGGGLSKEERIFIDLQAELDKIYEETFIDKEVQANVVRSQYLDECNLLGAMYNYISKYGSN